MTNPQFQLKSSLSTLIKQKIFIYHFFFSPGNFLKGNIPLKETSSKFLRSITNHILAAKDSKSQSSHYNNDSRAKERKKGKKKTYSALINLIWSYYKPKKLPDSQFIIVCQFCSYTQPRISIQLISFLLLYMYLYKHTKLPYI